MVNELKPQCIRTIICDDDKDDLQRIREIVTDLCSKDEKIRTDVFLYSSSQHLLKAHRAHGFKNIDIAILDIEMPGKSGFEVAHIIRQTSKHTRILFLTNHDEWSLEGYRYHPSRYVYKSFTQGAIAEVLEEIYQELFEQDCFFVKDICYSHHAVRLGDLLFIEAHKDITHVYTRHRVIETRKKLHQWAEELGAAVVQCKKSYLVCLKNIRRIDGMDIILDTEDVPEAAVPMSHRYKQTVIQARKASLKKNGFHFV